MILLCAKICVQVSDSNVWKDLFVAAVGGASAGGIIWLCAWLRTLWMSSRDKNKVYNWLDANVTPKTERHWYSSRNIASHTNLTQDRVRYVGSIDERVVLSTGDNPDRWGLKGRSDNEVNKKRQPKKQA